MGRRRLWWTNRPSYRSNRGEFLETKSNYTGGQSGRPQPSNISFNVQVPAWLVTTLRTMAVLLLLALAYTFFARYLGSARRSLLALAEGLLKGTSASARDAAKNLPAVPGSWAAAGFRPSFAVQKLLAARRIKALRDLYFPLGLQNDSLLTRTAIEWGTTARRYTAAWAVYRDAELDAAAKNCDTPMGIRVAKHELRRVGLSTKTLRSLTGTTIEDRMAPFWESGVSDVSAKTTRKEWKF